MRKREDESYIQFLKRITNACKNREIDYMQWGDSILGNDNRYSSENLRKAFYVFEKVLDNIDDNVVITEDDIMAELENLRDEAYKERCRLQDANREKRKVLREEARYENLVEVFKDCLLDSQDIELNQYKPRKSQEEKKYGILCLSDWHCGSVVDNEFNYYDIDTMIERATTVRDKALDYCKLHGVTDLVIELNGDMVDGLIHISTRVEQEEGVIEQIITVTEVLAKLINSMKPYFNEIRVVTTVGNHGRITSSKNDSITKENFEMLIPVMLRDKLKDVKVLDSKGLDFVRYVVGDKVICLAHGQNDRLSSVVEDFCRLYKIAPNEIHLGHTHGYKDINDCNIITSVNGSLIGSDDYSLTLRKVTTPSQNLIIYEKDRCIYEIKAE